MAEQAIDVGNATFVLRNTYLQRKYVNKKK